ncbi:MAG: DUF4234 domain-containing protein [Nocardioides sp.]
MTDQPTSPYQQEPEPGSPYPPPPQPAYAGQEQSAQPSLQPYAAPGAVAQSAVAQAAGPVGKVRSTGTCILLTIVTLGIYHFIWYYKTSAEMRRHSGNGLGGGIALLLAIFVGIVMPFLSSNEVGHLYTQRGQKAPVSAATGLWFLLLGWFFLVGAIVWFVKTNAALNDYWRSLGAR